MPSVSRLRGGITAAAVALTGAWGLAIGCSASSSGSGAMLDSGSVCPLSVDTALGAPCAKSGLVCPIDYSCPVPITSQQALCTCTPQFPDAGGPATLGFACTDPVQGTIPLGGAPMCKVPSSSGGTCPSSEVLAAGAPCSVAGLLCTYRGAEGTG